MFCLVIIGLYIWANFFHISISESQFYIGPLTAVVSAIALVLSALSYFVLPEKWRNNTTYAAYWLLLGAIAALTLTTGGTESPFIATWMIATIFSGIFGRATLALVFVAFNAYVGYVVLNDQMTSAKLLTVVLAGELPIIVSYILWHGKSNAEKTKDRAYYDLANELNQVSTKSDVVINAISDGVIAIDNNAVIELINPAAQHIVGWGNSDALGLDYKSVLQLQTKAGQDLDKTTDPVFEVLTTNQPLRRELQLQTSSGKKINVQVVVSPIGRIGSGAIIVFRDVTKEQEEEKAQAEFISTASHEMRTPVASIEGYLGLALNPATATIDAKARDFITKAHESAQHLGRLFQDLLDVTKADDGRLSNNPKVINVVEFTTDIIEGLKPKADEKSLRLFFKPATDDGIRNIEPVFYIHQDADHLREVLANLIENAIKYTPKGEVLIDVKGDVNNVVVSITDSGIGIPAEDIPHLFQKFYRVDNTDTREIGGTGLGLYLCRRLIEGMGGRIWVDSEYKKGSTFSIELARVSNEEAQRLIEGVQHEAVQPNAPVGAESVDTDDGAMTAAQKLEALHTPIIVSRSTPTSTIPKAPEVEKVPDILIQPSAQAPSASAGAQPLQPRNGMVLPPSLQALPSTLQTAAAVAVPPQAPPVIAPRPQAPQVQSATPAAPATHPVQAAVPAAPAPQPVQKPAAAPQVQTPVTFTPAQAVMAAPVAPVAAPTPQIIAQPQQPVQAARPIAIPKR